MAVFYRQRVLPQKKEKAGHQPRLFNDTGNYCFISCYFLQSLWFLFFASLQSTFAASFFSAANTGATDTTENIAANAIASIFFMVSPP
jgi:hypothetical protein